MALGMTTAALDMNQIRAQGWNDRTPTLSQVEGGGYALMRGHGGESVKALQERLQALGYDIGQAGPDGKFGKDLQAAVESFQRRNGGLVPDGKVGDKTYAKLFSDDAKRGPGLVARDRVSDDKVCKAESDRIARALIKPDEIKTDGQLQEALVSARTAASGQDPRALLAVDGLKLKQASLTAGTGTGTVKDYRGETITKDATVTAYQARGEYNLVEAQGKVEAYKFSASGRAGVDATGQLGGYVAHKSMTKEGEYVVAGSAGAYAGVDASAEWSLGARYFGIGHKSTVGLGAGAQVQGHLANENGVASASVGFKGGVGVTAGQAATLWVDHGQIKRDYEYAAGKVSEATTWAGNQISSAWNSLRLSPSGGTFQ